MDNRKANKELKEEREIKCQDCNVEHYDAAIKALRMQIPQQIQFDDDDHNVCPVCGKHVHSDDKYCRWCGQRIYL